MKRLSMAALIAALALLAGCAPEAATDNARFYSFSGSNGQLAIANGKLLLTDRRDELYGGVLTVGEDVECLGYALSYYLLSGGERRTLMMSERAAEPGRPIELARDAQVRETGKAYLPAHAVLPPGAEEAELLDGLYACLELTGVGGARRVLELKLDVERVEVDGE